MDDYELIAGNFQDTLETVALSADALAAPIEKAGLLMAGTLLNDRKILACGNGPDNALAQLFASNLLGCFEQERPALPAMVLGAEGASLTAISAGGAGEDVYARPLRALAQPGDALVVICSGLPAPNVLRAMKTARELNVSVVLLSNTLAVELSTLLSPDDVEVRAATDNRQRAAEIFTMTIHSFCALIDRGLFGPYQQD